MIGEFGVAGMQVPADLLQQRATPDGRGRIFSITVDPQIRFPLTTHLQGFVVGGIGWIRRTVELTVPTTQFVDYFDPFDGDGDLDPQAVTADQVLTRSRGTPLEETAAAYHSAHEYRRRPVRGRSVLLGTNDSPRDGHYGLCDVWHPMDDSENAVAINWPLEKRR